MLKTMTKSGIHYLLQPSLPSHPDFPSLVQPIPFPLLSNASERQKMLFMGVLFAPPAQWHFKTPSTSVLNCKSSRYLGEQLLCHCQAPPAPDLSPASAARCQAQGPPGPASRWLISKSNYQHWLKSLQPRPAWGGTLLGYWLGETVTK